ncbi:MAG: sugar phosphate isomerase/epimerase [Planctomycetes bacterium]|nr:sugar phosphate isomerase/epimerase [Planctomycetota bacterium]
MPFELGYNTNGFAHHRLTDALGVIADIGYQSAAITLDHHALDPYGDNLLADIRHAREVLRARGLCCVIETGARFLLDPARKHYPSLLDPDESARRKRLDYLHRAIEIAVELEAEAVSFWAGHAAPGSIDADNWSLLVEACDELLTRAVKYDLRLAFEPEPGMFIERMAQFSNLIGELHHPRFGLTLDVGHVHCLSDGTPAEWIRTYSHCLFNIHIEDMKAGRHDHLMFGDGDVDFPPIFDALREVGYTGSLNVELSRHSHDAVNAARQAFDFLSRFNA